MFYELQLCSPHLFGRAGSIANGALWPPQQYLWRIWPHSPTGTSLDETMLSNLFHNQRYSTKAIGKWHLGDAADYLPTARGFESYLGVPYSDDMQPLPLMRDAEILEQDLPSPASVALSMQLRKGELYFSASSPTLSALL